MGNPESMRETASLLEEAMAAHERGELEAAGRLYEVILAREPKQVTAAILLGVLRNQRGDHAAAAEILTQALRLSPRSVQGHLNLGIALGQLGRLEEAITHYRYALLLKPNEADTLRHLASTLQVLKQPDEALSYWERYLELIPDDAAARFNHGVVLQDLHRDEEALADFDRALAMHAGFAESLVNQARELQRTGRLMEALDVCERIQPKSPGAFLVEGNALMGLARHAEALACFDQLLSLVPDDADGLMNRGTALLFLQRPVEALACYDRVMALRPEHDQVHLNRGNALLALGRPTEALADYEHALALRPNSAEAMLNCGHALLTLKRPQAALERCDQALELAPDHVDALVNRGTALLELKRPLDALATFERALVISPQNPNLHMNHGTALHLLGRHREAIDSYDRALVLDPGHSHAHSNKIFLLDFIPEVGFAEHQRERRAYFEAHASRFDQPSLWPDVDRDPSRRLVLGYVSADFKHHSAASSYLPLLQRHAKADFKVICYSGVTAEDDWTARFKACAEAWRSTLGLSDEALAQQIREDRVDILIDLSGHSKGNRLLAFARKPAPIQVTAWGHAGGTGLPMIDYHFTDPVSIPPEVRGLFAETCYDLPCCITFEAPPFAPPIGPLPASTRGQVTFGSLNRYTKVTPAVEALWARILEAVPDARLLLKDALFDEPEGRSQVLASFERLGIDPSRIALMGFTSHQKHLAAYGEVDIVLDPFPQNGGITTWESLWMGTPVVAMLGNKFVSRISGAILHALGLGAWVARHEEEYLDIAVQQSRDLQGLVHFRQGIRERILSSASVDPDSYTRKVEEAYRIMWQRWIDR